MHNSFDTLKCCGRTEYGKLQKGLCAYKWLDDDLYILGLQIVSSSKVNHGAYCYVLLYTGPTELLMTFIMSDGAKVQQVHKNGPKASIKQESATIVG
jgi:hypothetical protein